MKQKSKIKSVKNLQPIWFSINKLNIFLQCIKSQKNNLELSYKHLFVWIVLLCMPGYNKVDCVRKTSV